jgi:hypothetical protein
LRADIHASMAWTLLAQGQLDAAEQATRKALALQADYPDLHAMLARIDILRGDAQGALHEATLETDAGDSAWARAAALQIGSDRRQADAALREYIAAYGADEPYDVADLHAMRHQPKQMFDWLQRAWTQRDPNFVNSLLLDPFVRPYRQDPRFAALCQRARLPLPGEVLPDSIAAGASAPSPADTAAAGTR